MYRPGIRNINESEKTVRSNIGYAGIIFFIILLTALLLIQVPPLMGLAMFLPGWIAAFGFVQAKNEFCVMHASIGVHYASNGQETLIEVEEESHRIIDRKRARRLHWQAVLLGVLAALASVGILILV